jgi:hypothetical protein
VGVVAVQHLNVDARLSHAPRQHPELPWHRLVQPLHDHLPLRQHADPCRLERCARGASVLGQEVGDAAAVHDPGAAAFDAHTRAPQRLAHLGQRARTVFELDREVDHRSTSVAAAGDASPTASRTTEWAARAARPGRAR